MSSEVLKLYGQQYDAFNFNTQFAAVVAGVQSGKTFLGAHWLRKRIEKDRTWNSIIVAPTYKILQAATLKKFFEVNPDLRRFYKEHKGEIVLPEGGVIYIRSADSPLGIEGITAQSIWLDEGGMTSVLTWTVLRSRVSLTRGQILITTTPYNMGWLYKDFYLSWKEKRDLDLSFFTWASTNNPYFSKEFYEAEQKRLPPEEFARRYQGEFNKMVGLVWDLPESQIIAPIDSLKTKSDARIMGIDWGFRNAAAISVAYRYDNAWYIVDEWKQTGRVDDEVIQVAQNKLKEHHIFRVYPDPEDAGAVEKCKRVGLPVYESNKDVKNGINHIRELVYQKRFFVYNTCPQTLEEISMYHYPDEAKDKEEKELPVKLNDHLMDAMRYAIYSHQGQALVFSQASPLPKPFYGDIDIRL